MTVTRLNAKYSKVLPDTGKYLMMPNDENLYSVITCQSKKVSKITEVETEAFGN